MITSAGTSLGRPNRPWFDRISRSHSITNPDAESEKKLLAQLAPELDKDTLSRLVAAFQDLREGYNTGSLVYPYSLRGVYSPSGPMSLTNETLLRADKCRTAYKHLSR